MCTAQHSSRNSIPGPAEARRFLAVTRDTGIELEWLMSLGCGNSNLVQVSYLPVVAVTGCLGTRCQRGSGCRHGGRATVIVTVTQAVPESDGLHPVSRAYKL